MSTPSTAGVENLSTILCAVSGSGTVTVAELCDRHGLARSSAFEIVRTLVAAGFLTRLPGSRIGLGPQAARLPFARAGLGRLAGPAVPVLRWLTETTQGPARLTTAGPAPVTLLAMPAGFTGPASLRGEVRETSGQVRALIETGTAGTRSTGNPGRALDWAICTLNHHLATPERP